MFNEPDGLVAASYSRQVPQGQPLPLLKTDEGSLGYCAALAILPRRQPHRKRRRLHVSEAPFLVADEMLARLLVSDGFAIASKFFRRRPPLLLITSTPI